MLRNMLIQILVDNPKSWVIPYAQELMSILAKKTFEVKLIHSHNEIAKGDILILLSCERILKNLSLNKHNLVVHPSNLPQGKGWSPLTWQILEGKNEIPITLFEATEKVDSGGIYLKDMIYLEGHELVDEVREKQGKKTIELILKFIDNYPNNPIIAQQGESSYYPKRSPQDSELDIFKTIDEQFNLLRVCDNDRYPAFFVRNGIKYILRIEKDRS